MMDNQAFRLPTSEEYWDGLADRIRVDAAVPLAEYATTGSNEGLGVGWLGFVSRQAAWMVPVAATVVLVLWISMPESPSGPVALLERSLAPDERAGELLGGVMPPSVGALLAEFAPEGAQGL